MSSITSSRLTVAARQLIDQGDHGVAVREIQRLLNSHGAGLADDGDFGMKTADAVRAFQRANGLVEDGIVGPDTLAKLRDPNANKISAAAPASSVGSDGEVGPTRRALGYRNGRPQQLTLVSVGNGNWLAEKAGRQFLQMQEAARRDGVTLKALSGFRSMEEQQHLYAAYKAGRGNLAAQPGHSKHQSGVAMDIQTNGTRNNPAYRWLRDNAGQYGFRNTVPSEPWHWEYKG